MNSSAFGTTSTNSSTLNEVKLISLIGMTGIGKSSLAIYLLEGLLRTRWGDHAPHEIPLIYVKAPANGDKSLSWKVLYTSILVGGGEVMHLHKLPLNRRDKRSVAKAVKHASNRAQVLEYRVKGKAGLAEIRGFLDKMLRERRVKLVVIDEVFHLLRFNDYAATMDTLKSLSDETETGKLMLIGNYDIADLVMDYAQVVRRGEIVHFKAYKWRTFVEGPLTEDEIEFKAAVEKLHKLWPCRRVPDLPAIWHQLMRASLGSVGMLKLILLRLAAQQMRSKSGESLPNEEMLAKSMKSPKALEKIMAETEAGEEKLLGACYGNSIFSGEELQSMCKALAKQVEKEAEHA